MVNPIPVPLNFLDDERFSRTFTLPPGPDREQVSIVTYSDYGSGSRENVILFCGPLLGREVPPGSSPRRFNDSTRYLHVAKDRLATERGVRIINIDRPGFGGTTEVDANSRVRRWLEIVPALLDHLGIDFVSVVSHSGGIIYALNTVLYLRHRLHPARPYVALCAPWIHPVHSGVSLMRLTAMLPDSVLCRFDRVAHFFVTKVGSLTPTLGGLSSSISFTTRGHGSEGGHHVGEEDMEDHLRPRIIERIYTDNVQGLSQDALLLLRRTGDPQCWGPWTDYAGFVPLLLEELQRGDTGGPPLRVDVFYSESDMMIGTVSGPAWFDGCWEKIQGDKIQYNRHIEPGADHDRILNIKYGVIDSIFKTVAASE